VARNLNGTDDIIAGNMKLKGRKQPIMVKNKHQVGVAVPLNATKQQSSLS
jgi:hypothetical protein